MSLAMSPRAPTYKLDADGIDRSSHHFRLGDKAIAKEAKERTSRTLLCVEGEEKPHARLSSFAESLMSTQMSRRAEETSLSNATLANL